MTTAGAVAAVIVIAITLYAWSGLADYGAGFWDLLAGDRASGRRSRQLIDTAVTPVWEANHVWLVFILITTWTAFGIAFASIMTTLFIPLCLAALGIVLRGASFALRKDAARAGRRHVAGWLFGLGSILTPFFLGAVLGGIVAGRVPVGNAAGNEITSWWNPVSILTGVLAVVTGAFLSAVYLVAEARRRDLPDLERYFWTRAVAAAVAGLVVGVAAAIALHGDNPQMFDRLISRSIPLLVLGALALGATMMLARRAVVRGVRVAAAVGVAALIWSWAVAQAPYLLPFSLTIGDGAGAPATLRWLLIWAVVALLLVVPALALLYTLDQRTTDLGEDPDTARPETDLTR
ncbi:cytochrome d ubiquinol oxidase subunit II [Catellatospora tritici]|uniref:cytochrome d ubiquinol oxidase subunit II n=1 Tax=Catellatospora tritici TaxID=2851566 RepID=UPI001C2CC8FF|nr:cytochrome d ubiquinol oxidase subunit II [Catellatospora tritici]MBV1853711.1 cytochrome d ubiquinol oxidase subunit II [Catellatospora tritici]